MYSFTTTRILFSRLTQICFRDIAPSQSAQRIALLEIRSLGCFVKQQFLGENGLAHSRTGTPRMTEHAPAAQRFGYAGRTARGPAARQHFAYHAPATHAPMARNFAYRAPAAHMGGAARFGGMRMGGAPHFFASAPHLGGMGGMHMFGGPHLGGMHPNAPHIGGGGSRRVP
jgi:hypothetical protein